MTTSFIENIPAWAKLSIEKACALILHPAWMPALLLLLLALLAFRRVTELYRRHNQGWLSTKSKNHLRQMRGRFKNSVSVFDRVPRPEEIQNMIFMIWASSAQYLKKGVIDLRFFYIPSVATILLVSFCAFLFLPPLDVTFAQQHKELRDILGIVFSGLGIVVVALIIFVVETVRSYKDYDDKRILLKASYLWPLTLLITLAPVLLLLDARPIFMIILSIGIAGITIHAFYMVITDLITPDMARNKNRIDFFRGRFKKILMGSTIERISNNILMNELGKGKLEGITYTPYVNALDKRGYIVIDIKSPQGGRVADINMEALHDLMSLLRYQKKTGLLQDSDIGRGIGFRGETVGLARELAPDEKEKEEIFLMKKIGDRVQSETLFNSNSSAVIAISPALVAHSNTHKMIARRLLQIFKLDDRTSSYELFRSELDNIKSALTEAIRDRDLKRIDVLKKRYMILGEAFLENLHELNSAHSPEDVTKESGGFFSEGWHEVRWLQDDLREILTEASESNHKDIILDIAYVPIAIAARAIKVRDHLLFRRFLDFSTYLYHLASEKPSGGVREIMTHRAWKYPEELVKYHLRYLVDDSRAKSSKDIEGFGLYTFTIYMKLIKAAFDKRDEAAFKQFLSAFDGVKDSLVPEKTGISAGTLEKMLEGATREDEKVRLISQLEKQQDAELLGNSVNSAYNEIIFGISGWILDQVFKDSDVTAKTLFSEVSSRLPKGISELTKVLEDVVEKDSARKWGWDWWDIVPDGKVRWVDTDTMPSRLFCFQALRILDQIPQDRRQDFSIPPSRYIARAAEQENSVIKSIVSDIKEKKSPWGEILSDMENSHADIFLAALEKTKIAQKEEEQKRLRSESLSPARIASFRGEVKEYLSDYARMKKMMQKLGLFQSNHDQNAPDGVKSWGFNQLDEKAVFLDNWYSEHVGWGQSYGEGLARSEDRISFKRMIDAIPDKKEIHAQDAISEIERAIFKADLKDPIVIQSLSHSIEYEDIRGNEKFIAHYDDKCPQTKISDLEGFIGVLTCKKGSGTIDVPVFDIFAGSEALLKNKILVTDIQRFACWRQYAPVEKEEDRPYVDEDLLIHVSDLNQDDTLRAEILKQNPDWLQSKDNKEDYLRGRVVIKVFEKFDIEIKDPAAAVCLNVTDAEDPAA